LAKDTIVIFATDNGCSPAAKIPALEAKGHKPNADWRGHKADIFEGGHRVPFLVRWPGRVKAGTRNAQTICTADLFATVADVIGKSAAIPANAAEDSFSFLPALLGQAAKARPFTIHHSINGSFAIRRGKWKLALCPGSGGWSAPKPAAAKKNKSLPLVQLYDLAADPAEQNNLQAKHPELVSDLVATLAEAIKNGRTTPGPAQANEGHPNTFSKKLLTAFPALGQ
jgi:arylsulfatase A-like enzyme